MGVRWSCLLAAIAVTVSSASVCSAQPLVTGDLSLYYNFDSIDEDGFWLDGSGNGLNALTVLGETDAKEDGLADIRLDTTDKVRGAGSAWFDTNDIDTLGTITNEDYIAVCDDGAGVGFYPEGCDIAEQKGLVPERGFTVAAWVKVEEAAGEDAIWQSRADGGGYIHTQAQSAGRLRMQLRGDLNTDNIVGANLNLEGGDFDDPDASYPFDEWFHFAGTYEKGDDPNGFGTWAFYYNGEQFAGGEANGEVAGDSDLDKLGNWGRGDKQGAMIGLVPDRARQLVGRIDEFYLFKRMLSPEEIKVLYEMPDLGIPGDFDGDGQLTTADIDDLTKQSASGTNPIAYDLNADTAVNVDDVNVWIKDLKNSWVGDADLDGEFNSGDLVTVLSSGTYEIDIEAVWSTGDFNGDGRSNSSDLVAALSDGGYELGPRAAVAAVPEPSAMVLLLLGSLAFVARGRNRK